MAGAKPFHVSAASSPTLNNRMIMINPTMVLKKLLSAACAGLSAVALVAQTPPASHETHGTGAESLQGDGPIAAIHAHLCGFHFYSGDLKRVVRVEHYCSHLNADVLP